MGTVTEWAGATETQAYSNPAPTALCPILTMCLRAISLWCVVAFKEKGERKSTKIKSQTKYMGSKEKLPLSPLQHFTGDANIPHAPSSLEHEAAQDAEAQHYEKTTGTLYINLYWFLLIHGKKSAWLTKLPIFRSMLCFIQISNTCKRKDSSLC